MKKSHLQFCKRYLQVHNKASNIACTAELGKFPMIIDINKKILNYLDYLRGKDEDSIVKQALHISIDLHHNGKTSFYSKNVEHLVPRALPPLGGALSPQGSPPSGRST